MWFWLLFSAALALTIHLLAPILTPFLVGIILAYIGDPLVDRLEARWRSRTVAVTAVFVAMTLLAGVAVMIFIPLLQQQIETVVTRGPDYLTWLYDHLSHALAEIGIALPVPEREELIRLFQGKVLADSGRVTTLLGLVSQSGMTLLGWLSTLMLIPVVTFYMLRDWDLLLERLRRTVPRKYEKVVVQLATESDQVLSNFFRGQLMVMGLLGAIYAGGLMLVGLDLALLIGMVAGVVSFVPYLGFIIGILAAGIAAAVQFQELLPLLGVVAVFTTGQLLEGMVLVPRLLGESIGLHPVAVIFAIMAGGELFGFLGVLLALPVMALVMVGVRHLHRSYLDSGLYLAPREGDDG
ncbi:MAG: AI-2E family transporter [Gammaproteobacteria bacterium]|nr:AI-2E family transporter [Gammaproteobacteria bacterium]